MAGVTPNPQVDAEVSYNNQAYQPNTPDDFSRSPPYPPQSPSPPPETTGYYPQQYPQQSPMMYPPPQSPSPPGYYPPQYPQQAPVMHAPPGQQQQQTTVVYAVPPPVVVQPGPYKSYFGMIVLAVVVFMLCNPIFGMIAFALAGMAEATKAIDARKAQKFGKASMWLSIVGIIVTVVIVAIAVGVSVGTADKSSQSSKSGWYYNW